MKAFLDEASFLGEGRAGAAIRVKIQCIYEDVGIEIYTGTRDRPATPQSGIADFRREFHSLIL